MLDGGRRFARPMSAVLCRRLFWAAATANPNGRLHQLTHRVEEGQIAVAQERRGWERLDSRPWFRWRGHRSGWRRRRGGISPVVTWLGDVVSDNWVGRCCSAVAPGGARRGWARWGWESGSRGRRRRTASRTDQALNDEPTSAMHVGQASGGAASRQAERFGGRADYRAPSRVRSEHRFFAVQLRHRIVA